jgi:hypothetical protein
VNDTLNKPMPDNIASRQFYNTDAPYAAQAVDCLYHSAFLARRQVYLRYVAGYYHFRAVAQPSQDHKHLQRRGVLGLIADYHRFIECPAPHKGKRDNLNNVHLRKLSHLPKVHHILERIKQRTKIWVDLRLDITGEKPELFTRLDGGPGENYTPYLLSFKHRYGDRHRQISLTRSGGAYAKRQVVSEHRLNIAKLPFGGGLNYFFVRIDAKCLGGLGCGWGGNIGKDTADIICGQRTTPEKMLLHLVDDLCCPVDVFGFAGNEEIVVTCGYSDAESITHQTQMTVGRPEQLKLPVG